MADRRGSKRRSRRGPAKGSGKGRAAARRSFVWRWRRVLFLFGLLFVAGAAGLGFVLWQIELPPEEPLLQTSFICSAEVVDACGPENALAELHAEEDRVNVGLAGVPDVLTEAVLAAEDQDFFSHAGVDPFGIARAAWNDIRDQQLEQGGSTITQQYVKNVYLSNERTLTRKIREAILSIKLEQELSKEEILERYLNTVYFGRGAYGVGAAARAYFGRGVDEIGLAEAAYLAGLIRAPESADASRDADEAARRRLTVLDAMLAHGYITPEERDLADSVPFDETHVEPRRPAENLGDVADAEFGTEYFAEYVRQQLLERFDAAEVYGGGLRVYTTLDRSMQRSAWDAVTSTLDRPEDPAASLVAVDDQGMVRAMVGGTDFAASEVNLAVGSEGGGSGRQPGSSFKPFAYARAVKEGISPQSRFSGASPVVIPAADGGQDWEVKNYGNSQYGVLTLDEATRVSSNTVYAQLMDELGPENVVEMAKDLGITADIPAVHSLVLGAGEVSVLDMASAYSTFARRGLHVDPVVITRIERADGSIVQEFSARTERALEEGQADTVVAALRRVVEGGTGTRARLRVPAAGKTGTTQDNRDAWFVGFVPKLTAAVWMGFPDPGPNGEVLLMSDVRGRAVVGGSFPAEIWRKFMERAIDGIDVGSFSAPPSPSGLVLGRELTASTEATTSTSSSSTTSTTKKKKKSTTSSSPSSSSTSSTSSSTTTTTGGDDTGGDGGPPTTLPTP